MARTKHVALGAMLTALALALSYMERLIPLQLLIPLPGIKLGLANLVTVFALYTLGTRQTAAILLLRCTLGAAFSSGVHVSRPCGTSKSASNTASAAGMSARTQLFRSRSASEIKA